MTIRRKDAEWRIAVDGDETSALYEPAENERAVFVCAHGAGGHMRDRRMESLARVLRERGFSIVRFNFLYREHGSRRPDAMPLLKQTMTAVIEHVRKELQPRTLIIGGRSMGGRAASMLAADGLPCDGLLLLAYPLHPAGKPEKLRDAHLSVIADPTAVIARPRGRGDPVAHGGLPVLCINGTRDPLCRRDIMERVVAPLDPSWTMHWLDHADHSFHVLKSSGTTDTKILEEVAEVSTHWLEQINARGQTP